MVFRFVLKARNDFEYKGHPSRFVHLFDADVVVDGEKNDFAFSIKAGLSSVLMFI